MMEKYVRVSDIGKDKPAVYTAEEIADSVRGAGKWEYDGGKCVCFKCGCVNRDGKRFCTYCGAKEA
jgi:hypothetical protein